MIKISLDEAYVFDYLSILEVKISQATDIKKSELSRAFAETKHEVIKSIGSNLYDTIVNSYEYNQLIDCNKKIFLLVDRANECELSKLTADSNYERYLLKTKLQEKFFQKKLLETKLLK